MQGFFPLPNCLISDVQCNGVFTLSWLWDFGLFIGLSEWSHLLHIYVSTCVFLYIYLL